MDTDDKKEDKVDRDRRNFLRNTVVASAVIAVAGAAAVAKSLNTTQSTAAAFPTILITDANTGQVANVNTLTVNEPILFYYPLEQIEPNLLIKLGQPAQGGIGPDGDIVAFSDVCQHLGCYPGFVAKGGSPPCNKSYVASGPIFYCCCHGSKYDLLNNATIIQPSPAPCPVPAVMMDVDDQGNIYAIGMGPPTIKGHGTQCGTDVSADLEGGTIVSATSSSSTSTSQETS